MAIWKANEPVHGHPSQSAHEELALYDVRAAYQHHLRVEHSEMRFGVLHPCEGYFGPHERVGIAVSRIACENGVENSLGGVAVSGSSMSRHPWRSSSLVRWSSSFLA